MSMKIKLIVIKILRVVLRFFFIFPIKNNYILFSSFEGKQFSDNPKYLYNYISEHFGSKYKYVWVLNNKDSVDFNGEIVSFLSIKHIYYLMTCKYLISNLGLEPFVPKRKNQIFINTWHGSGAYKSQTLSDKIGKNAYLINMRDYRACKTDFYISGCEKYSEIMASSWNAAAEKFLPTGTPRNDLFFFEEEKLSLLKDNIYQRLGLNKNCNYILFAPTFRGKSFRKHESDVVLFDIEKVLSAFEKRFGKPYKLLFRSHVGAQNSVDNENVIDVSGYPDMQEILLVSDVLITDYSSSMWDFAFLNRPGFLFVPDLNEYLKERDFYTPIETWPFKYVTTEDALIQEILNFDEDSATLKIKKHQDQLGSYEKGTACEQIVSRLAL